MPALNTTQSFGWVSRILHWLMAIAIFFMLGLGNFIQDMKPSLSTLWLFGLHKSIGITLLVAIIVRVIWHRISPPPASLTAGIPGWQVKASVFVHRTIYILLLAIPLSGWIASMATGIDVVIFKTITLPALISASEPVENAGFLLHGILTKLLVAFLLVHIAGALQRQFLHKDQTLTRMIRG